MQLAVGLVHSFFQKKIVDPFATTKHSINTYSPKGSTIYMSITLNIANFKCNNPRTMKIVIR